MSRHNVVFLVLLDFSILFYEAELNSDLLQIHSCYIHDIWKTVNLKTYNMNANNRNSLPYKFIDDLLRRLNDSDATGVGKLLSLKNEKYRDVYFKEDAKQYLSNKLEDSQNDIYIWLEVVEYYILARNSLYNNELTNGFELLTKSFTALINLIKVNLIRTLLDFKIRFKIKKLF